MGKRLYRHSRILRRAGIFFVILIILFVSIIYIFNHPKYIIKIISNFLITEDTVQRTDVIVVIGGAENDKRIEYGAELYLQEFSNKIFVSGAGDADFLRKRLITLGIQGEDITIENISKTTYDNAVNTKEFMIENNFKTISLVTSPDQSKRAKMVFSRILKKTGIKIYNAPIKDTIFVPEKIMESKTAKNTLVLETVKYVYYFFRYIFSN